MLKGTANNVDDRLRARGATASLYGEPLENDKDGKDVYVENEELKEEIQKLAGQIQYVKIVGMLMDNHHLKPKKDGYFSKENFFKHIEKDRKKREKDGRALSGNSNILFTVSSGYATQYKFSQFRRHFQDLLSSPLRCSNCGHSQSCNEDEAMNGSRLSVQNVHAIQRAHSIGSSSKAELTIQHRLLQHRLTLPSSLRRSTKKPPQPDAPVQVTLQSTEDGLVHNLN